MHLKINGFNLSLEDSHESEGSSNLLAADDAIENK